jgi:hypothetical protein
MVGLYWSRMEVRSVGTNLIRESAQQPISSILVDSSSSAVLAVKKAKGEKDLAHTLLRSALGRSED